MGSVVFPLSQQVRSTIEVHGLAWAAQYYARKGVPLWQFLIFAGFPVRSFTI